MYMYFAPLEQGFRKRGGNGSHVQQTIRVTFFSFVVCTDNQRWLP